MSREDAIDLILLSIIALCIWGIAALNKHLKPRVSGGPAGDSLACWTEQGLPHHALNYMWGGDEGDADDE